MTIFNYQGMMIFPSPIPKEIKEKENVLVINECYCQEGHSLLSPRVKFNNFNAITLKIKRGRHKGTIALSPIYGDNSRFSLDIDLISGEIYKLCCQECGALLPIFSSCKCGGDLVALFTTPVENFTNCIAICNRVDCHNSTIKSGGDLLTSQMLEAL